MIIYRENFFSITEPNNSKTFDTVHFEFVAVVNVSTVITFTGLFSYTIIFLLP